MVSLFTNISYSPFYNLNCNFQSQLNIQPNSTCSSDFSKNITFNATHSNTPTNLTNTTNNLPTSHHHADRTIFLTIIEAVFFSVIIISAVVGNLLVISSVLKYHRLRTKANVFIVSLAFADLLVAIIVMPFNASQELADRWLFGRITCDVFNANDVLFTTASLVNLCCISMDRYIAIIDPFNYSIRMSKRRIIIMLSITWSASLSLSHLPIHSKLYTSNNQEAIAADMCTFPVNWLYSIISSFVSFWIPAFVMVFTYRKIYTEAKRQVKNIEKVRPRTPPSPYVPMTRLEPDKSNTSLNHCLEVQSAYKCNSSLNMLEESSESAISEKTQTKSNQFKNQSNTALSSSNYLSPKYPLKDSETSSMQGKRKRSFSNLLTALQQSTCDSKVSYQQQESRRKMRSEHKAAKTLGVIMGVFLGCWLPFFLCYLSDSILNEGYQTPRVVISILYWIGYCNSALNPIIYACFNRDFRKAFKQQLCFKSKQNSVNRIQSEKDSLQSEFKSKRKFEQV